MVLNFQVLADPEGVGNFLNACKFLGFTLKLKSGFPQYASV